MKGRKGYCTLFSISPLDKTLLILLTKINKLNDERRINNKKEKGKIKQLIAKALLVGNYATS